MPLLTTLLIAAAVALPGAALPSRRAIPSGWSSLGCYLDAGNPRVLAGYLTTSSGLTQESCIATCASMGYAYAGVEYGNECYCASQLASGASASNGCTMSCAGSASETCGGGWAINVFYETSTNTSSTSIFITSAATSSPSISTTSSLSISTTSATSSPPSISTGTFSTPISTTISASITITTTTPISSTSISTTATPSSSISTTTTTSTSTSTSTTTSSVAASASGLPSGWSVAIACAQDNGARILTGYETSPSTLTPSLCASICQQKGFAYAGVEYANECHCGNGYNGGTPPASSGCVMPCAGASGATCGGSWAMQVYHYSAATTSVATTATSVSTFSMSTSTSAKATLSSAMFTPTFATSTSNSATSTSISAKPTPTSATTSISAKPTSTSATSTSAKAISTSISTSTSAKSTSTSAAAPTSAKSTSTSAATTPTSAFATASSASVTTKFATTSTTSLIAPSSTKRV